jgi:hypothetical protein
MTLVSGYFDASENDEKHGRQPTICVAGYFFEKDKVLLFDAKWRALLSKYGLSHFSMADCNSQWGEFKNFTPDECDAMQIEFFAILKSNAFRGFAAAMATSLAHLLPSARSHGIDLVSPHSFCSYWCLFYGRLWSLRTDFAGRIAYFYEQGDLLQPEFARIIDAMFSDDALKEQFYYASHTFADKRDVPQLQAADILAWQWRMNRVRSAEGKPSRQDLVSLLDIPTDKIDFTKPTIEGFLNVLKERRLEREGKLRELRNAIRRALRLT